MFGKNEIVSQKYFSDKDAKTLMITSIFITLQGEGPFSGRLSVFVRLAKCNLACTFCFAPTTKILMSDGKTKNISDIKVNDMVISWGKDKFEAKRVARLYESTATELVKVSAGSSNTWVTPEHPYLTSNRGWVNAKDLIKGDVLVHYNSSERKNNFDINRIKLFKNRKQIVHNFEVEDNHTYVANGNVVHNCDTWFDSGKDMTFEEIFNHISHTVTNYYSSKQLPLPFRIFDRLLLVITGGDPMLQKNIVEFLHEAHQKNYDTQIETNGIVYQDIPKETHLVISPKINERITKYIIPNKKNMERADSLKFVVSASMPGYLDIPDFALDWYNAQTDANKNMYVSPMNEYLTQPAKLPADASLEDRSEVDERISFWTPNLLDPVENQKNHEYTAFIAMKHNCKLSLQTHLYASLP